MYAWMRAKMPGPMPGTSSTPSGVGKPPWASRQATISAARFSPMPAGQVPLAGGVQVQDLPFQHSGGVHCLQLPGLRPGELGHHHRGGGWGLAPTEETQQGKQGGEQEDKAGKGAGFSIFPPHPPSAHCVFCLPLL